MSLRSALAPETKEFVNQRGPGLTCSAVVQEPEELLNTWSSNIGRLLGLVEKSCQQISKECMVHKVVLSSAS